LQIGITSAVRASAESARCRRCCRKSVLVVPGEQLEEAHQRGPEARRHPAEQDAEEDQDGGLQAYGHTCTAVAQRLVQDFVEVDERPALVRHDAFHVPAGDDGLAEHQGQQDVAADRADRAPARRRQLALGRLRALVRPVMRRHMRTSILVRHGSGTTLVRLIGGAIFRHSRPLPSTPSISASSSSAALPTVRRGPPRPGRPRQGGGRVGRQALVQLAERGAAGEFRALLVAHRQMGQVLAKRFWPCA
jgi:hypothetical protein